MINNIQQLLRWSLAQRKNVIGEDKYLEGRISAIQDCIELLDEHERDVRKTVLEEISELITYCETHHHAEDQMYFFVRYLKEMK